MKKISPSHPASILAENLEFLGIDPGEAASRLGDPLERVERILSGKAPITIAEKNQCLFREAGRLIVAGAPKKF